MSLSSGVHLFNRDTSKQYKQGAVVCSMASDLSNRHQDTCSVA
jgi:hypothetical protein